MSSGISYTLYDPTISGTSYTFNLSIDDLSLTDEILVSFKYREIGETWIDISDHLVTVTGTVSSDPVNLEYTTGYEYKAVIEYSYDDTPYTEETEITQFLSVSE